MSGSNGGGFASSQRRDRSRVRRALEFGAPHLRAVAVLALLTLLVAGANAAEALVQEALDTLIADRDERGRHRELVASNGYYASLVARQTRGLIRNEGEPL